MLTFKALLGGLKMAGEYAAVMAGAGVALKVAERASKDTPANAFLAGPATERFMSVLDPLDLSGYRAGKGESGSAERDSRDAVDYVAGMKDDAINAANELRSSGKGFLAQSSERWFETAEKAALRAKQTNDRDLDAAARELAGYALRPPVSAMSVLATEGTDEGRALKTTLVDAVNRSGEFDADALVSRMANPGSYKEGQCGAPTMAGSCCSACASGAGSCPSLREAPDEFIDGSITGEQFMLTMNGEIADDVPFYDIMPATDPELYGDDGEFFDAYMNGPVRG